MSLAPWSAAQAAARRLPLKRLGPASAGGAEPRVYPRYGATLLLLPVLVLVPSSRLSALQCPDGTPPPCRAPAPAAAPRAPTLDPNRIAILPFRVTAADTLLGEGLAELLATELTGESGPRAVHMGTVLRAWRRAGGGPRRPLGQVEQMRVAREVDAGLVVDGSVVGLGSRLTLTASVVAFAGGAPRRVGPVSGPADSLESLVGRLASGLVGATGREQGAALQAPLTASPPAMRAYLEGLGAWRRYDLAQAGSLFERALAEDSTFARAAFMRLLVAAWATAGNEEEWQQRAWSLRGRLSPADRVLLFAYLGESYPAPRSPWQEFADLERAAAVLPESPEAQFLLGDWLIHSGAAADVSNRLERAIAQIQRSLALDTQGTALDHLAFAAALQGDSVLARSLRDPLKARGAGVWGASWLVAAWLDDRPWLEQLFSRAVATGALDLIGAAPAGVRPTLIEERLERGADEPGTVWWQRQRSAIVQGRPAAAVRAAMAASPSIFRDQGLVIAGLFADGDSAAAAEAVERLVAWRAARCPVALWRARQGRFEPGTPALLRAHGQERCAIMIELWRSWSTGGPDLDAIVARADSVLRLNLWGSGFMNENVLLARVWESRGNLPRALAAIRLRPDGLGLLLTEATSARMEGRIAALVGDTAGAVYAYRRYLRMRRYAEPALIPQRDSVAAELARLER